MSRLAVVGSTEPHDLTAARLLIRMAIHWFEPEVIVSGGAKGIDQLAALIAEQSRIRCIEHLPKHQRWAPEGFKDRNIKVAEDCTHLVRIANRDSLTYGSGWTADYAEQLGRPVFRFYLSKPRERHG